MHRMQYFFFWHFQECSYLWRTHFRLHTCFYFRMEPSNKLNLRLAHSLAPTTWYKLVKPVHGWGSNRSTIGDLTFVQILRSCEEHLKVKPIESQGVHMYCVNESLKWLVPSPRARKRKWLPAHQPGEFRGKARNMSTSMLHTSQTENSMYRAAMCDHYICVT